jgi:peroxiredoxin
MFRANSMSRFYRALTALMLLAVAYAQSPAAHPLTYLPIKTPDTKGINLRQFRGKEVILVLFSTECEGCIETVAVLSKIERDFASRGLQVVGAAIDVNAAYMVTPWVQRYRPSFPVGYLDQESVIKIANLKKDDFAVVPIVLFIDSIGVVRVQYNGKDPIFKSQQDKALRAIANSLLNWQVQHAADVAKGAAPKPDTPPSAKPEPK